MLLRAVSKRHPGQTKTADDSEKCARDSHWDTTSHNTPRVREAAITQCSHSATWVPTYRCSSLTLIGRDAALACFVTVAGPRKTLRRGPLKASVSYRLYQGARGPPRTDISAGPHLSQSLVKNAVQPFTTHFHSAISLSIKRQGPSLRSPPPPSED